MELCAPLCIGPAGSGHESFNPLIRPGLSEGGVQDFLANFQRHNLFFHPKYQLSHKAAHAHTHTRTLFL